MRVLLNLNKVGASPALMLHSTRVSESKTISCASSSSTCQDIFLMSTEGPAGEQRRVVGKFEYKNPTTFASPSTSYILGLDGSLSLSFGLAYTLTATHLCWEAATATEGGLPLSIVGSEIFANVSGLASAGGAFAASDAITRISKGCGNGTVSNIAMFPNEAANEAAWLGLQNTNLFESAPNDVDARRNVVEAGTACASEAFPHAYSVFQLDCLSVYTACETDASLPFRRMATQQMRLLIPLSTALDTPPQIWAEEDLRLYDLPRLNEHATNTSIIKLVLMLLAALVIWARASKQTAYHSSLFIFCLRSSRCLGNQSKESTKVSKLVLFEDAAIGLIAILARFAVAGWRYDALVQDDQLRAPLVQIIASVLSLLHWVTRNIFLEHECEVPLTKLGGSTAMIDATSAVCMAFASPPLLVSATGRFDSTARMLVALIIATTTIPRCLFAAACCGLLASFSFEDAMKGSNSMQQQQKQQKPKPKHPTAYLVLSLLSAVAWLFQAAGLGVLISDAFCTPLAFSMHRLLSGSLLPTTIALFFTVTVVGMPEVVKSVREIAQEPVVPPEI
jgi:hypothetical protein